MRSSSNWARADRSVNHRAARYLESSRCEQPIDLLNDGASEIVGLKQAAKLEHRRGMGSTLVTEINLCELTKQGRVVERLFAGLVSEVEPQWQEMNPQHPLQPDRRAPIASLRVV